jgi:hypothetical protein
VTFISSRPLLGTGDMRATTGHQNNSLRRARARLSYRLGILNILWWGKEVGGGWALGKMVGKKNGGDAGH